MKYSFHPEAEEEFHAAIEYYESCAAGMGYDFSVEVHGVIERIFLCPKAWPELMDGVRRCLTNRFPCGLLYNEEGGEIYILAVMHLRRDPEYWQEKIK